MMTKPVESPRLEIVKPQVVETKTLPRNKAPPPRDVWSLWRWFLLSAGTLGVVALGWFYGVPAVLGPLIAPTPVVRTDLVQTIVASGHIETPFRITVSSQIGGIVTSIPVIVGDKVRAGDLLIQLDDIGAQASLDQAKGILAQAVARVDQQRELTLPAAMQTLASVKATLDNVQEIYTRTARLASTGIVSTAALQLASANLGTARAQVASAELQVESNQDGGNDFLMVKTQENQATAALTQSEKNLGNSKITAARDGTIISQTAEVGNVVQPGIELLQLSPDGKTQIVIEIDEKNLSLVSIGQTALASADAYGSKSFPAEVVSIDPAVDLLRAAVTVKLDVDSPPPYLRQDMTLSVDIEVNRKPNALVINVVDLHELSNGMAWVLRVDGKTARRQAVKVGLVSSGKAEIIDGLNENDLIVPAAATAVTNGKRVRVATISASKP